MIINRRKLLIGSAAGAGLAIMPRLAKATTLAQLYGTSTSFTMNATAWAQAVTISSTAISLSGISPVPDDVLITFDAAMPSGSPAAQKAWNMWFAISEDGTHYTDNDQYAGTQNSQTTLRSPTNFLGPYVISAAVASITVYGVTTLRQWCGLALPRSFGIIMENQCNLTPTSPAATYTPINWTNS